jgi:hypothetical protein
VAVIVAVKVAVGGKDVFVRVGVEVGGAGVLVWVAVGGTGVKVAVLEEEPLTTPTKLVTLEPVRL